MTETELLKNRWQELIDRCPLDRKTPLAISNVSHGFFSIARLSGCVQYQGKYYIYVHPIDAVIREDVHIWAIREMHKKPEQKTAQTEQQSFFEDVITAAKNGNK